MLFTRIKRKFLCMRRGRAPPRTAQVADLSAIRGRGTPLLQERRQQNEAVC